MERRGALQSRARSSFEKAHGGEAPPRLQVIGFDVSAPQAKAAETAAVGLSEIAAISRAAHHNEAALFLSPPPLSPPKPASSPRSALQQLLLTQSLPATLAPSPNHSLPRASLLPPPSSSVGLQLPAATSSPTTNQNVTSGLPRVNSPPSAYQGDSSSRILKSRGRSGNANTDDDPATQTVHIKSLGQSQRASSSSPGNRTAGGVSVNVQVMDPEPSRARPINEENHAAFYDDTGYTESVGKAESRKISWFHPDDEEPSSADKCSTGKGVPQCSQRSLTNEKSRKSSWMDDSTSKRSSLFMFVVSSPVLEVHCHLRCGGYDVAEDTNFLSSCHLCRRRLGHGKDVFMYSGDKAFCSMECRYQQIVIDERKERCPPRIIRSGSSQVYQHTSINATSPSTATGHPIAIGKPHFINTAAAA